MPERVDYDRLVAVPQDGNLVLEGLQLSKCRVSDVETLDGHWTVPLRAVDGSERTRADARSHFDVVSRDLPLLVAIATDPLL